ncbi:MAG: putative NRPS-like protein biosynthetic cluster [Bathelium mastoideum]|nr:MAG: putative NRPS-like protein biosynthetic cluster [Bathelium mastoideum]
MPAFIAPKVNLDPKREQYVRTLPELVDFQAENNPQHLFCIQAEGNNQFVPVSYEKLRRAIIRCQAWLEEHVVDLHSPFVASDGHVKKFTPVAILMESHVGLAICVLSLMGLGVPAVLLSARLSAPAVRHLIRETGAKIIVASPRLQSLASEAFSGAEKVGANGDGDGTKILQPAGYEDFLSEREPADAGRMTRVAHPKHFVSEEDRQVLILHSSGTSGLPKPIPCSHRYYLGYATCHTFSSQDEALGLTVSTLPFFHGFGFVMICLSLSIGKTICIPSPSIIPNGASIAALIQEVGAKALVTVPSILEEIESLPNHKGYDVFQSLDFVGFGGGAPKASVGERLDAERVRLVMQYGATESGPLTPFFKPAMGYNWRRLRLRSDTLSPLQVKLERLDVGEDHQPNFDLDRTYKYRLSLRPFGWKERFELQDLIVTKRELTQDSDVEKVDFAIAGRTDDLICLATGEKVRPTILESLLRQHEGVKDAAAFGEQQFELVVIVETTNVIYDDNAEDFKASIWPAIEEAGRQMDAHARISSPDAVLVVPPGTLPRSDKGTILRNAVAKKFAEEIAGLYRRLEASSTAPPLDLASPRTSIRALVTKNFQWQAYNDNMPDDDDFFVRGIDSLQATILRRLLTASIRATHAAFGSGADHVLPVEKITNDFVYLHPSITKLVEALIPKHSTLNGVKSETETIEQLINKYTNRCESGDYKKCVVLTGGTGSLGCFFLEQLLHDDSVARVICLNRPGKEGPLDAQKLATQLRGITVGDEMWAKVEVVQTNTAAPCLGLTKPKYEQVATAATHIVHIAWPMNFKMGLRSYEASFASLQNLIQLASEAQFCNSGSKPRILFVSSISTVGNYPAVKGEGLVPEAAVKDPACTLSLGYAKAKFVCENIIQRANFDRPGIEAASVRVGQLAGASNGYWNANEHFVAVCASSQKIGKFPDLRGTLSWLPVDSAAKALSAILFDQRPLQQVYHLENPVRQSWKEAASLISAELGIPSSSIISWDRWLDLVASAPAPDNPAASLIDFLREDFLRMSCGSIVLDTSNSRMVSSTMSNMRPVGEDNIKAYLSYWRKIKVLK